MKSFTRSQSNVQAIRPDARFDALVKQERAEHQAIIASHHKEMQDLRDALRFAMERFASLSDKNVQDLKEFKTYVVCTLGVLIQRVGNNEGLTAEQWKTIQDLHEQLHTFQVIFSSKIEVEKIRRAVEGQIKDSTMGNLSSFQDFQREMKVLVSSLKEDLMKLRLDMESKSAQMVDKGQSDFSLARIDKDGVLNELRVYKMDMFVIEKKIENIYTLIERINKRDASCHKQE